MKVVGLTGGIGSGKSTVAKMFKTLGIPVYMADDEAKGLMNRSKIIRKKLIEVFGEEAYLKTGLNRPYIANKVFKDKSLLSKLNSIVHPKVASHFKQWIKNQNAPYVIKEAAILFENGSYKSCDYIVTVIAPEEERINRVVNRDNTTKEKVLAIIENQWNDTDKIALSDYVITNLELIKTEAQVLQIHEEILKALS
jgi:dephospho-CoA kinase